MKCRLIALSDSCLVPDGLTHREIEEHEFPHSCLECEYFILEENDESCKDKDGGANFVLV